MNPVSAPNLSAFTERWPKTRIGILRLLWPTIQECLAGGHSLRDIHQMLKLDGIDMAYSTLCWAVAALRHDSPVRTSAPPKHTDSSAAPLRRGESPVASAGVDPLRNLRRLMEHRPGFEYRGTMPDEELFGTK